jgi:hypothetical protein
VTFENHLSSLSPPLSPLSTDKPIGKDKPAPVDPPPSPPPATGSDDGKTKPEPKPKPTPPSDVNYMIFSYHVDDSTCDDSSMIESHGYVIENCYTGRGDLTGLFWSFSVTNDETNYFLNYGFYSDSECMTTPVVSSTETVPYGCAARGNSGGYDRYKNFVTSTKLPKFKDGVLFNGYQTEEDCHRHKKEDVVDWSFLSNNQCDPDIYSPVYGDHVTDETRSCQKKKKGKGSEEDEMMMFTLFDTNDMTCSGAVTTTTNINSDWDCKYGSNSGAGAVYQEPKCV